MDYEIQVAIPQPPSERLPTQHNPSAGELSNPPDLWQRHECSSIRAECVHNYSWLNYPCVRAGGIRISPLLQQWIDRFWIGDHKSIQVHLQKPLEPHQFQVFFIIPIHVKGQACIKDVLHGFLMGPSMPAMLCFKLFQTEPIDTDRCIPSYGTGCSCTKLPVSTKSSHSGPTLDMGGLEPFTPFPEEEEAFPPCARIAETEVSTSWAYTWHILS